MHGNKKFNRYWNTEGGLTIVELTQGQYALFNSNFWEERLKKHVHFFDEYVKITWNKKPIRVHRIIMDTYNPNIKIDHKNGDKLDNRVENLRIATISQNMMNRSKQSNNSSGFKNVSWDKRINKWVVQIGLNKNKIHIGSFKVLEDAIKAAKEARLKYHKEFSKD